MTRSSILALALTLALPAASLPAAAQGVFVAPPAAAQPARLTGQRLHISRQLYRFGYNNVDVSRLSNGQVAQIAHLLHSDRSHGEVRGLIGSALRRGLLQRGIDRLGQ